MSMMTTYAKRESLQGFSLIEVLVAVIVLMFGLLALAGLLARTHTAEFESYQRKQAIILLQDMVGRLMANRNAASCYGVTTNGSSGTPYLGTGSSTTTTCSVGAAVPAVPSTEDAARAVSDVNEWSNLLKGTAEVNGTAKLGAALDARGCIVNKGALALYPNVTEYEISVTWRGTSPMDLPGDDTGCAKASYDAADQLRRVVSARVRIPLLN